MPPKPPANKKVGQPTSNNNKKQPGPQKTQTASAGKRQAKPSATTTQARSASSNADGYEDHTKTYVTEMLEETNKKLLTENAELKEKLEQYEESGSTTDSKYEDKLKVLEDEISKLKAENKRLKEKPQNEEQVGKEKSATLPSKKGNGKQSETPEMQKGIEGIKKVSEEREKEKMKELNDKYIQEQLKQKMQELENSLKKKLEESEKQNKELKKIIDKHTKEKEKLELRNTELVNKLASAENQTKQKETHELSQLREEDKSGLELQKIKEEYASEIKRKHQEILTANNNLLTSEEQYKTQISEKNQELQTAHNTIATLKQQMVEVEKKQQEILTAKTNLSKAEEQYKNQIESKDKELQGKISELSKLQEKFDVLDKKQRELTVSLGNKETEILQLKEDVKRRTTDSKDNTRGEEAKLRDEVNTLRHRLSQMAGAKLTDNNPSIADLSDPNRATKLSENFSELYDNEWTDALEELMGKAGKTEENGIADLLKILIEAYSFCESKADDFTKELKKSLKLFITEKEIEDLPAEMSKLITDHKKSMAVLLVDRLQKGFKASVTAGEKIIKYTQKCVTVCWFMTIQSPPVYIDTTPPKGNFDKDSYKAYTKSGKTYKFLVWPILYLHKKGPILGKGVAQGK